jgi:shikimate kinase
MRVVLIAGPPCAGKTTLAQRVAISGDVVLDYDSVAQSMGSPVQWIHPEPYRTMAEQEVQAQLAHAYHQLDTGTCWLIRLAPRPATRMALAGQWGATVYVLSPGERECRRRARQQQRPSGTGQRIGQWYHHYRSWLADHDAALLGGWVPTYHASDDNE